MTPLQKKIFDQEYDRLINQPVNKITELELKYMREFFRINYAEIENRITDFENAMLEEENKMDLYKVFQHGLNAEGEWEHVLMLRFVRSIFLWTVKHRQPHERKYN